MIKVVFGNYLRMIPPVSGKIIPSVRPLAWEVDSADIDNACQIIESNDLRMDTGSLRATTNLESAAVGND